MKDANNYREWTYLEVLKMLEDREMFRLVRKCQLSTGFYVAGVALLSYIPDNWGVVGAGGSMYTFKELLEDYIQEETQEPCGVEVIV